MRWLRELRPDTVLCFQHYGDIVGTLAARLAGAGAVVAHRTAPKFLEPGWTRWLDRAFGMAGLFNRIVANSKTIADEHESYRRRYQARLLRIDHGFETKRTDLSRSEAQELSDFRPMSPYSAVWPACTLRRIRRPPYGR